MESLPSHSSLARVIQFESRLPRSVMGIGISLKSRGHPHKRDKIFPTMFAPANRACDQTSPEPFFSQAGCIHNRATGRVCVSSVALCKSVERTAPPCASEFTPVSYTHLRAHETPEHL